ncbi:MAG: NADPH-dependent oxidoreductase [Chitinophagaceae bacterium]|nr:MAG: NADPH-dependent oxidoreductase [Chitinophagaceae bacterium]
MKVMKNIVVISATNRPGAYSLKLAIFIMAVLKKAGHQANLLDLAQLPADIFLNPVYYKQPDSFSLWQQAVNVSDAIIFCLPEYNGGIPGVLKYFLDMLSYPDSIKGKLVSMFGLSAGHSGAVNAMNSLTALLQFQKAKVFTPNFSIPRCFEAIGESGEVTALYRQLISDNLEIIISNLIKAESNQDNLG